MYYKSFFKIQCSIECMIPFLKIRKFDPLFAILGPFKLFENIDPKEKLFKKMNQEPDFYIKDTIQKEIESTKF